MNKTVEEIFLECEIKGCIERLTVLSKKLESEGLYIGQWTCDDAIALIKTLKEKVDVNQEVSV